MTKRPAWQRDIIDEGELYRVGGSVRDELMGVAHDEKDVDYLVRGITPEALETILSRHGKAMLVGKSFGVHKFRPDGEDGWIDIAFPRREVSTGPGHRDFSVDWDPHIDVESDLRRRDFTINAIAQRLDDGRFIDPLGGRRDIDNRVLRMVFAEAFEEDPLRILRGIRFATRFSLDIDKATETAMAASAEKLSSLSAERVQEEFTKLLSECDTPSVGLEWMRRLGALAVLLPELDRCYGVEQNEYHPDDVYWHTLKSIDKAPRDNLVVRWAALLHDLGKVDKRQQIVDEDGEARIVFYGHEDLSTEMSNRILRRLRYSSEFIRDCTILVQSHMFHYSPEWSRSAVRRFIRRVGEGHMEDLFQLREADVMSRDLVDEVTKLDGLRERVREEIESDSALKNSDMAIDGHDVIAILGLSEGQEIGKILSELFDMVLESPELNTREALTGILRKKYGTGKGSD